MRCSKGSGKPLPFVNARMPRRYKKSPPRRPGRTPRFWFRSMPNDEAKMLQRQLGAGSDSGLSRLPQSHRGPATRSRQFIKRSIRNSWDRASVVGATSPLRKAPDCRGIRSRLHQPRTSLQATSNLRSRCSTSALGPPCTGPGNPKVELTPEGFVFTGQPATPPPPWKTLVGELAPPPGTCGQDLAG